MSDFKMPDLGNLMQVAQKMQADVAKMQEELAKKTCEASSGGGMVTAVVNGQYELVELKIDPATVDPNDVGMLQDLVVAAINQAIVKVREMTQAEMGKITGGMGVPGMPNLF
ncbi:MAG: YbaB/EbfC family nucleoid-associated protein [Deltaproteobacteria bacterium]|nr:YbaB/EbfC family nucleoid-associated protein [Deltaproteobacteria bacterium]